MEDRIAKERLNVILLVDASKSMAGKRIKKVNEAIEFYKTHPDDKSAKKRKRDLINSKINNKLIIRI